MRFKILLVGLLSLFLLGCGTLSAPTPVVQTVKLLPPAEWLQDCPFPPRPAQQTNEALARWLNEYDAALDHCNTDKFLLREWARE